MDKSRRAFTAGGLLASVSMLSGNAQAGLASKTAGFKPSAKTLAFTKKIGIRYPIVQAVMGGATPELAAAVAQAGGLGGMGLTWSPEGEVRNYVTRVRAMTQAPFAVGYVLAFGASTLPAALEAGAPVIQFSFGIPRAEQVAQIRQAGAKFGIQISNLLGAKQAFDVGADYISCQGQEAGGHNQAQSSWHEHLDSILHAAGTTPVLVAGGLSGGVDLRKVLAMGAAGGVFGTRFVASKEYPAHPEYHRRLLQCKASDTVLTVCFDGGWPGALHRVLRNPTLDRWEADGAKFEGARPGVGDIVGRIGDTTFERYSIFPPFSATTGQPEDMAMYAGRGVGEIQDIAGAGELVRRIWAECLHG
ncbi:MAG: nitronate monooxygenase [Proteobacteria bacterium]|nr:nitronate monooxygenase [Pseudomonadota bacterium]